MADNHIKTTSSKIFNERSAHILTTHNGVVRKMDSKPKQSFQHATEDWQTLVLAKNKLKRKKKLSASLTSVGDAVNQEKRTRIEGIQLNLKSKYKDNNVANTPTNTRPQPTKVERTVIIGGVNVQTAAPPQRFKRKLQENLDTIQKLNALAEQLRLEVNELKSSLLTERGAVRSLRAQNEADSRKWRVEVKKLQQALETNKKLNANSLKRSNELTLESSSSHVATDGLNNYEIQRLTNEITLLKEANKAKEEKSQLEELKTKERNIGQLKKDLLTLQHGKRQTTEAKTKPKTNELSQKLKKPTTNTTTKAIAPVITIATKAEIETNTPHPAQVTNEITQLKNIELINNKKYVHKSQTTTATKAKQTEEEAAMTGDTTATWMGTLLNTTTAAAAAKSSNREYRTKDANSDTDSALSSAPPSISPQPPSSGADSGVMWQALQDLDKLQKEVEIYHKENQRLQTEVQLLKQELQTAEKAAMCSSSNNNTHINELQQRIKELEEQQLQLSTESDELREQNELLEFRILELEDDKMDGSCEDQCQRLQSFLRKSSPLELEDKEKRCLQQLLQCVQQLDLDAMAAEQDSSSSSSWQASTPKSEPRTRHSRIVATVQPYNNSATPSAPTTPSKANAAAAAAAAAAAWQSSSLSESGVFVECDSAAQLSEAIAIAHPHLQYYQQRLEQLESKLLVYESSGETQAKHLAQRLQRELQLSKQVKELAERVELLLEQNALLDEAKCEFEEAENDTRLHLQCNEQELEILRQRNVELEFSKEALGAKYRDCRAECLILREDLCAAETQLEHLQVERKRAKQQLESLRRSLPLLLICRLFALASHMGNQESAPERTAAGYNPPNCVCAPNSNNNNNNVGALEDPGAAREINYLKDEVKNLRCSLKELNTRHYEAMETADSHWLELEQQYKEREEAYRIKEVCLKQKINKLQDCLREDSRAAAEKIQQLEEAEQGLKTCLVRITKEHRDLMEQHRALENQLDCRTEQDQLQQQQQLPLTQELENEKRRSKALMDDLKYAKKLQQNTEEQLKTETDNMRQQIFSLRKEFLHTDVTNGELKEEVRTLECKIGEMEAQLKLAVERACCLEDELRTKDEQCQRMERKLGVCPEGFSLADELYDNPAKRARREECADLEAASQGLGCALRDAERRERELPTHKDFQTIACSVKQLADHILSAQQTSEVSECECPNPDPQQIGETGCGQSTTCSAAPATAEHTERTSGGGLPSEQQQQLEELHLAEDAASCSSERQAAGGEMTAPLSERSVEQQQLLLCRRRRQCRRFNARRLHRCRVRRSGAGSRPSQLQRSDSLCSFHSAASVHTLHTDLSGATLHSQRAQIVEPQWERAATHGLAQTEPTNCLSLGLQVCPETCDAALQAQCETQECGVQADNVGVEQRLMLMPARTRAFLELLQASISDLSQFDMDEFRARVLQLWEGSEEFREHIELLQELCVETNQPPGHGQQLESYDAFVAVLGCVRALKFALKPSKSPVLEQLEERINERLISYHNQKVESEFYCTIYYPVERRNALQLSDTA
ncbi:CAP-Gly domain-containing linker protein 1 isoform X3 [Drosophila busckii]|uniref:CAP-Gly domain-containing linker protein 1 isoform X3 n=1 Tax=Drosophila busckii TaxID=30019 RepID=UPI00083EB870|nr:CAP-Gly domain-containing linker protein 1 isoform X3 [Drosophila busckii]